MNTREAKAIELADRGRVVKQTDHWLVFSLSGPEKYTVRLSPLHCSCPDFELRHDGCKHTLAAILIRSREGNDPSVEQKPDLETPPIVWPRKTY